MGEKTAISWTDHTFNPWWGCARVSPGCDHCYAAAWARRTGHAVWGQDAPRRFFGREHWREPLTWNDKAEREGVRRRVFCGSMCDVFEDRADLREHRRALWRLVEDTTSLDWLLLTKRPENVRRLVRRRWLTAGQWPRNAWLGTTAENQEQADHRSKYILGLGAPVTFLSCEPLLGPIELHCAPPGCGENTMVHLGPDQGGCPANFPDWIIVGGESGAGARPCDLQWIRSLVKQCQGNRLRCFVKQLGSNPIASALGLQLHVTTRNAKGADPAEWEPGLRVREFPEVTR